MKRAGLIASIVAAGGAAGLMHLYLQRLEAEVSGGPKISVLVAAEDVPIGVVLTEKALAVHDVPQAYIEARHVRSTDVKKIIGVRVASGLKANEAVLWSDLTKFGEHARVLSGLIQNGLRAVAIDGRTLDFDGLLRPGDRVDVLFSNSNKEEGTSSTSTILQNLLVLSVGGSIGHSEETPGPTSARGTSVTLSATVEQAQLLTQAQQQGRLTLSLRNSDDIAVVEGVPETYAKDLQAAKDRLDWHSARGAAPKGAIEHVR
jgi:Flp pilus assembly protein CpaB